MDVPLHSSDSSSMVSNIIYRAIPFPIEEELTDSLSDAPTFSQLQTQLFQGPLPSTDFDDLSVCNLSTESLNSEITHVCIDSLDDLDRNAPSFRSRSNKRKSTPKKKTNDLSIYTNKRLPLDVVYGNSLLVQGEKEAKSKRLNPENQPPTFLSVTDLVEFEKFKRGSSRNDEKFANIQKRMKLSVPSISIPDMESIETHYKKKESKKNKKNHFSCFNLEDTKQFQHFSLKIGPLHLSIRQCALLRMQMITPKLQITKLLFEMSTRKTKKLKVHIDYLHTRISKPPNSQIEFTRVLSLKLKKIVHSPSLL